MTIINAELDDSASDHLSQPSSPLSTFDQSSGDDEQTGHIKSPAGKELGKNVLFSLLFPFIYYIVILLNLLYYVVILLLLLLYKKEKKNYFTILYSRQDECFHVLYVNALYPVYRVNRSIEFILCSTFTLVCE